MNSNGGRQAGWWLAEGRGGCCISILCLACSMPQPLAPWHAPRHRPALPLPAGAAAAASPNSLGGVDRHLAALHELVTLPLRAPELFARYRLRPPRGVLLHGPPGTGEGRGSCSMDSQPHTQLVDGLRVGTALHISPALNPAPRLRVLCRQDGAGTAGGGARRRAAAGHQRPRRGVRVLWWVGCGGRGGVAGRQWFPRECHDGWERAEQRRRGVGSLRCCCCGLKTIMLLLS